MDDRLQELKDIEVQRGDIVTKLKKIEDKKHTVSTEVYEKVRTEYEDKLKALDGKMSEHIDLIKEQLTEINQEEQTAVESEKQLNMHLEEIELRYTIGEYSEEDYNTIKQEHESKLKAVKDSMKSLNDRKSWLGNFINVADTSLAPEPEPVPALAPEPASEEPAEDIVDAALEPIKEAAPEEATDSIQIEEHILEEKLPDEDTKLEELIVEEEAIAQAPEEPSEEAPSEEAPKEAAPAPSTEKDKSIACPKCGHLNTPDSWYCEKCGAEILDSPIS
ncbi:hypothetical protein JXB22_02045 [candidate division WOR-3 bacterium]|nr:hypothetical protein [candidate division WOR-3 bacterium]